MRTGASIALAAWALAAAGTVAPAAAQAQAGAQPSNGFGAGRYDFSVPPASSSMASAGRPATAGAFLQVPRVAGRLTSRSLGLVINTVDPYSVAVGEWYIQARKLEAKQVLRVALPVRATLTPAEFAAFAAQIEAGFDGGIEALALAWTLPYAVDCNSITGALALGFDASLCDHSCAPSKRSPYFNSASIRPHADLKLRPSMLLAAPDVAAAKAMIQRGVTSDGSLLRPRGGPPAQAYFVKTNDTARSVRAAIFPPAGLLGSIGVEVHVESAQAIAGKTRVLVYETGAATVDQLGTIGWLPGALADHLTSFGGRLDGSSGQMSSLAWIASGATASYGTVSEPCAHLQKFPHPQVLLLNYLQGATAIEAYWKSVAWPQQGVFIGEPLAAPFAR